MPMREWMIKRIKKAGENIESTLTQIFFVALLGGSVAILAFSKKALTFVLQLINTPTPLWTIIAVGLVLGVYIYLKKSKINSLQPSKKRNYVIKYFTIANYKWETKIYNYGSFEVDEYPFCATHDLKFIFGNGIKYCPGTEKETCNNKIRESDHFRIYQSAKSIIENKVRNKTY